MLIDTMEQGRHSESAPRERDGQQPSRDESPARSGRGAQSALAALRSKEQSRDRLRPAADNPSADGSS